MATGVRAGVSYCLAELGLWSLVFGLEENSDPRFSGPKTKDPRPFSLTFQQAPVSTPHSFASAGEMLHAAPWSRYACCRQY